MWNVVTVERFDEWFLLLKELRVQHNGRPYRIFFAFDPIRQAVLLCGGDKTGKKRFYEIMIPVAEHEFLVHLSTIDE